MVEHEAANEGSESSFQVEMMPVNHIRRRDLYPYSVHYSLPSSCWIATIVRRYLGNSAVGEANNKPRYSQFEFASEGEAKRFCKGILTPGIPTDPFGDR